MLTSNISKRYGDSFMLDVDFTLDDDIMAVMGSSGAGKTTLLECIAGLTAPDEGEIVLNGGILFSAERDIDLSPGKRKVGMVLQDNALFPHLTLMNNVLFSRSRVTDEDRSLAVKLLDELNIAHLKDKYPGEVSGGERQRAAIARALIMEPDILLFDEPTSSLDKRTSRDAFALIRKISSEKCIPVMIASHDDMVRSITGNILYLCHGRQLKVCDDPDDFTEPWDQG